MTSTDVPVFRFLCFGVGAIGTYIGGSLQLAGQEVVFFDRPQVVAQIREQGLKLNLNGVEHLIEQPVLAGSIEEALTMGPYDLAILAVKSFDTLSLMQSLEPYKAALPPIYCLQNGVENELLIQTTLGKDHVIPGTLTTAIGRRGIGNIIVERLRGIGVASGHKLVPALVGVLDQAGLNAVEYSDAGSMKWSKMLTNLLANASSAILDMTPAEIFAHPGLFRMEVAQIKEAVNVMTAMNLKVIDLPKTPTRALILIMKYFPASLAQPILKQALGKGRGEKMPSFHIDLHQGRGKSEVDYLDGAVVRFGRQFGIPTPVNQFLNQTLLGLTDKTIDMAEFARQPEKLIARLGIQ